MPLIVHTRSAEKETIEILHKNLKKRNFKIVNEIKERKRLTEAITMILYIKYPELTIYSYNRNTKHCFSVQHS